MPEPVIRIEWRGRMVHVYVRDELRDRSENLGLELVEVVYRAETTDQMARAIETFARDQGIELLTFYAGGDHLDPLQTRISVGFGPGRPGPRG